MKLNELMNTIVLNSNFDGILTVDDYILAVNTAPETNTSVSDYAVIEAGIVSVSSTLDAEVKEKQYIRAGKSSTKTGTQRIFKITGDRYIGDEAQDFLLSHAMKYANGDGAITDYVYFNMQNGIGEKGQVSVFVESDGGGNASETSSISIELKKFGSNPQVFTYSN